MKFYEVDGTADHDEFFTKLNADTLGEAIEEACLNWEHQPSNKKRTSKNSWLYVIDGDKYEEDIEAWQNDELDTFNVKVKANIDIDALNRGELFIVKDDYSEYVFNESPFEPLNLQEIEELYNEWKPYYQLEDTVDEWIQAHFCRL